MANAKKTATSGTKAKSNESAAPKLAAKPAGAVGEAPPPDTSKQDVVPDVPVATLTAHAEALANIVDEHAKPLTLVKVTTADAASLRGGVAALRELNKAWKNARKASAPGTVASARELLTEGREDLFGALRLFAPNADTQAKLGEIAGVDDDDDLDADVEALLPLAAKHAAELEGTEVTPKRVKEVEALLEQFRAARAGVRARTDGKAHGEGVTTAQSLSASALKAQRARNAAFWALSALDRLICARARFGFRRDAKLRALFASYIVDRVGSGKVKAPADKAPADKAPASGTGAAPQHAAPDGAIARAPR